MKKIIFLIMPMLLSSANATEFPSELLVKKELEKTQCASGSVPTYKFMALNPVHSYVLKDGNLILSTSEATCPEGYHFTGSFCVEVICAKPEAEE